MKLSLYTKVNPLQHRLVKGDLSADVCSVSKIAGSSYRPVGVAGPADSWQDAALTQRNANSV
jgi:hypothetical protein